MKRGIAAVAVAIALAMPALGQHGGSSGHGSAHAGFSGHGGSVSHAGFAGRSGFSGSRSFGGHVSRPGFSGRVTVPRYSGYAHPGFAGRGFSHPLRPSNSGFLVPRHGPTHRPPYGPGFGDHHRGWDRDHDRWGLGWHGSFGYVYPGWTYLNPYPYVIDPWPELWADSTDYGDDQAGATNNYAPYSDNGQPYSQETQQPYDVQPPYPQSPSPQQPAPQQYGSASGAGRPSYAGADPSNTPVPEERLTLIFKDGRPPQSVHNYMMNAKELTDLDPQHFARIPLEQIDIAATAKANRANGVDFQVPAATQD